MLVTFNETNVILRINHIMHQLKELGVDDFE